MYISDVKTAFKIADVELVAGSTKLNFNYLKNLVDENGRSLPRNILSKNYSRVYIITANGEIMKIGASQDKWGMKWTLNIYRDGGIKGRPSIRSFGIWYFLYHSLLNGKNIEFYMIYHDDFEMEVKWLFGLNRVENASISCKLIEWCCIADYINKEGCYPAWNIQEQWADWSEDIKIEHSKIMTTSLERNTTRKKIELQ